MLPPYLRHIKDTLTRMTPTRRTTSQGALLDELEQTDKYLERQKYDLPEELRKGAVMGPTPGKCPTCGGSFI